MARIAVIGGGLAGLTAAFALQRRRHDVVLVEAGETLGGQLQTERKDGFITELGAEGFVARSESVPELARALELESELVGQLTLRSLGLRDGVLRELAAGEAAAFLGFQVAASDLGQGIKTFARGMGSLIDALRAAMLDRSSRVELHTHWPVDTIERLSKRYRIVQTSGLAFDADRVVIATSARAAARVLRGFGPVSSALESAHTLSSVTVSLAYPRAAVAHPLDATGFVVATESQEHGIRACTFTSSKFAGRAPADSVSLRVFCRPNESELEVSTDASYVKRASGFLERVLEISAPAQRSWVSRWASALPVIDEPHKALVAALEQAIAGSGVALAGSAFHGAGIDAAVRSGLSVSDRL